MRQAGAYDLSSLLRPVSHLTPAVLCWPVALQVRLMDMELHQRAESEGGDCDRHYLLDGKVVECPLGCGEQLTFYQQMQHLSLYCENRLVECPRRSECGESMPFRMLAGHQAVCPARVVSCGCEDRDCARTLRCWLEQRASRATGEAGEEQEEGQAEEAPACSLVACDQHGSTALAWAVHHHDVVLARHLLDLLHSQGTAVVAAALRAEDHVTGSTPLTIACARGADDLVHMMLERVGGTDAGSARAARMALTLTHHRLHAAGRDRELRDEQRAHSANRGGQGRAPRRGQAAGQVRRRGRVRAPSPQDGHRPRRLGRAPGKCMLWLPAATGWRTSLLPRRTHVAVRCRTLHEPDG